MRSLLIIVCLNVAIVGAVGQESINSTTNLVSVAVTVTDRNGLAFVGLQREDFRIYDDKVEQAISFFSEEDTPASISIVLDTSKSMSGSAIERAKEALAHFIQTSHPQDEFFLIGFGSRPQLLLDRTRDGQAVLDEFTNVHPMGNTALFDAVNMGLDDVSQGAYSKHAIILISDGEENNSRISFGQLRRRIEESGATVYTVRVGSLPLPKSIAGMVMDQIAKVSGGKSFWPSNSERMDEAFEQIALELRRQYSIGYLPANFVTDGRLHKIKVVLNSSGKASGRMFVRNREGYYATAVLPSMNR